MRRQNPTHDDQLNRLTIVADYRLILDEDGHIVKEQIWEPLTKESAARRRAVKIYREVFQRFKRHAESGTPVTHDTLRALLDYYQNACQKARVRHYVEQDFIEAVTALVRALDRQAP